MNIEWFSFFGGALLGSFVALSYSAFLYHRRDNPPQLPSPQGTQLMEKVKDPTTRYTLLITAREQAIRTSLLGSTTMHINEQDGKHWLSGNPTAHTIETWRNGRCLGTLTNLMA